MVARILNQLSISAWLPAAALVLLLTFVIELANVLDDGGSSRDVIDVLGMTFNAFGSIGASGLFLLLAAVVTLTMLTQAFAFGSIRALEGYWGTWPLLEGLATTLVAHQKRAKQRYLRYRNELMPILRESACKSIQSRLAERPSTTQGDPDPVVLEAMARTLRGKRIKHPLNRKQQREFDALEWRVYVGPDLLLRATQVGNRIEDFPDDDADVLPTRLGNIIRRYEAKSGTRSVRGLVDRNYESLPFSLQIRHDEQRTRLDLYCTMVFVWLAAGTFGAVRLIHYQEFALGSLVVGLLGAIATYQAALSSGRAYGPMLVEISRCKKSPRR